jgi:hypothetical protein
MSLFLEEKGFPRRRASACRDKPQAPLHVVGLLLSQPSILACVLSARSVCAVLKFWQPARSA